MKTLNHVSLFSGLEGFSLGLALAGIPTNTILYVEQDQNAIDILRARIKDELSLIQDAPIWNDVRSLSGRVLAGKCDIITAGPPCPPFSSNNNGARQGEHDPRNLFPEVFRLVDEIHPRHLVIENVQAITYASGSRPEPYARTIVNTLSEMGYDSRWGIVEAKHAGANHKRGRWFLLADSNEV